MAVINEIKFAELDALFLDPGNPRLGRENTDGSASQEKILDLMKSWTLDELAVSFVENGFWIQEAVLVAKEEVYGKEELVVIEGNRRLAALKYLQKAKLGQTKEKKWLQIAADADLDPIFKRVPYILVENRKDVEAFLGFRHVTGIKEWKPAEKAEYITKLIEDSGMSYVEVMRKIGSKTPTVRQNYISYRLLLQMEEQEGISIDAVEDKFSVLFLSLRTDGVKKYLNIDINAEPEKAKRPVPEHHLANLKNFALWLFGDEKREPIVNDSRQVDNFGRILESPLAVEYLERSGRPSFQVAFQMAGGDEPELVALIEAAADNIEAALSRAHIYASSEKMGKAIERVGIDALQLLSLLPDLRDKILQRGAA